jgi:hypothetical protein
LDLLEWQPPETVHRFDDIQVRAATIGGRICRAISAALTDCARSRGEIAEVMTTYLGQRVTLNMLNAYASQAREEHQIPLVRFVALVHATGDRRLLELLAELFGWTVIERKYLPLIDLATVQERAGELERIRDGLRRAAKRDGLL